MINVYIRHITITNNQIDKQLYVWIILNKIQLNQNNIQKLLEIYLHPSIHKNKKYFKLYNIIYV